MIGIVVEISMYYPQDVIPLAMALVGVHDPIGEIASGDLPQLHPPQILPPKPQRQPLADMVGGAMIGPEPVIQLRC
jgi:hypothetical protein